MMDAAALELKTISCIGAGLSIIGRVVCTGQAQVFGRISGALEAADVLIGAGGEVHGEVIAQDVTIRGRCTGTVRAARVKLQGHAAVEGDIFHQSLSIEEFVLFEGASRPACPGCAITTVPPVL